MHILQTELPISLGEFSYHAQGLKRKHKGDILLSTHIGFRDGEDLGYLIVASIEGGKHYVTQMKINMPKLLAIDLQGKRLGSLIDITPPKHRTSQDGTVRKEFFELYLESRIEHVCEVQGLSYSLSMPLNQAGRLDNYIHVYSDRRFILDDFPELAFANQIRHREGSNLALG